MKRASALTLVNLPVALNATTPSAPTGSLIWSTTANGVLRFNGTAWVAGSGGGTAIAINSTPPSSPTLNDLWLDTST